MANIPLKSIKFPGLDDTYTIPQIDQTLAVSGKAADAKKVGDALATKANQDGYYSDMTAGNAEQLVASIGEEDEVPYNFRTAGGAIDIGDRLTEKIVGGTVAWNQYLDKDAYPATKTDHYITFTNNGDGSVTANGTATAAVTFEFRYDGAATKLIAGHKYLYDSGLNSVGSSTTFEVMGVCVGGNNVNLYTGGRIIDAGVNEIRQWQFAVRNGATVSNVKCCPIFVDLTQMFGSTIADYLYSLETATPGAGVAWFKKLFPKPYYPYNAGELMSVKTSAHKTVGFNAWDEEWEVGGFYSADGAPNTETNRIRSKNYIRVIGGATYYVAGARITWFEYDNNKTYLRTGNNSSYVGANATFVPSSDCSYIRFQTASAYGNVYHNDICINLAWDGSRDGEYEPYEENVYPLDSDLELRGIPKLDSGNNLYYDGDTYESDGTVTRRYGIVDLGTLTWGYASANAYFYVAVSDILKSSDNMVCSKYQYIGYNSDGGMASVTDKTLSRSGSTSSNIQIKDTSYSDAAAFKTAMSGVYLVYELATPTTESADPYQNPQIVNDFGTEEYVDERTVAIPVGHESFYAANLKAKLEMAPDSPDGNGDYIVRQTNGVNEYVPLVIPNELPTVPGTDGAYVLKCTVNNGTATYSWVSAT